jgi:hypothetical protein
MLRSFFSFVISDSSFHSGHNFVTACISLFPSYLGNLVPAFTWFHAP